jgi:hypothetical protein
MTNDEARMTKEARMSNDECQTLWPFVIRVSSFLRHSDFNIRHSAVLQPQPAFG